MHSFKITIFIYDCVLYTSLVDRWMNGWWKQFATLNKLKEKNKNDNNNYNNHKHKSKIKEQTSEKWWKEDRDRGSKQPKKILQPTKMNYDFFHEEHFLMRVCVSSMPFHRNATAFVHMFKYNMNWMEQRV